MTERYCVRVTAYMSFDILSSEIAQSIFYFLNKDDLNRTSQVCKRFLAIINNNFWKVLCEHTWTALKATAEEINHLIEYKSTSLCNPVKPTILKDEEILELPYYKLDGDVDWKKYYYFRLLHDKVVNMAEELRLKEMNEFSSQLKEKVEKQAIPTDLSLLSRKYVLDFWQFVLSRPQQEFSEDSPAKFLTDEFLPILIKYALYAAKQHIALQTLSLSLFRNLTRQLTESQNNIMLSFLPRIINECIIESNLDGIIRPFACNVLYTLVNDYPQICKDEALMKRILNRLFELIERSEESYFSSGISNVHGYISNTISMICTLLPPQYVFEYVKNDLQVYYFHYDWKKRRAAVHVASVVIHTCKEEMLQHLSDYIKNYIPKLINDSSDGVKYETINLISKLTAEFPSNMQDSSNIVSILLTALQSSNLRLTEHTAQCLVNFVDGIPPEKLKPYEEQLLKVLLSVTELGVSSAIAAISACATAMGERIEPYYDMIITFLVDILSQSVDMEIIDNAIESITIISMIVSDEIFYSNCSLVLNAITKYDNMLKEQHQSREKHIEYLINSYNRLFLKLKSDFLPYLDKAWNLIINALQLPDDVRTFESDDVVDLPDEWETSVVGDAVVAINTRIPAVKKGAMQFIFTLLDSKQIDSALISKLSQIIPIVTSMTSYIRSDDVRESAAAIIPHILRLDSKHFIPLLNVLLNNWSGESDWGVYNTITNAIEDCVQYGIDQEDKIIQTAQNIVDHIGTEFQNAITNYTELVDGEVDQEIVEDDVIEEEIETMLLVIDNLATMLSEWIKHYPTSIAPLLYDNLKDEIIDQLEKDIDENLMLKLFFVIVDLMDFSPEVIPTSNLSFFIRRMIKVYETNSLSIRQTIAYAFGIFAEKHGAIFPPFKEVILKVLFCYVDGNQVHDDKYRFVYDNSIASLVRISIFHETGSNQLKLLAKCFESLPLKEDKSESRAITTLLCEFILSHLEIGQKFKLEIQKMLTQVKKTPDLTDEKLLPLIDQVMKYIGK